ncbi:hypothetical protein [Xanthomonas citri]|uniref:hypothetical protein n=2 Tax=Xanthomonas citri TaxID=346 RepID=UPI0009C2527F|nr:hypothetical protein [Xanthomonas citri]AMU99383.1 hypothetical protein TP37_15795 [Xanthomonas citri pv. aurantifolii]TBX01756.1 hypothetical protein TP47_00630 [Xanthomonas citri pv. aurantifolii]TBX04505.1 hypothetical protein TP46_05105 [Xanthomonas citri pv. aurantifolii]
MSRADDFIRGERVPDIVYHTVAPEEDVCPRITVNGRIACVYMHNERSAPHKGFVPVAAFLYLIST